METITWNNYEIPLDALTVEDMPSEVMAEIFELCGVETAVKLLLFFSGNQILIPTRGFIKLQEKLIIKKYDGRTKSIRELARTMNISERYIRNVLNQARLNPPVEGQLPLFEEQNSND